MILYHLHILQGGLNPPCQSFPNPSTHFTIVDFGSATGRESSSSQSWRVLVGEGCRNSIYNHSNWEIPSLSFYVSQAKVGFRIVMHTALDTPIDSVDVPIYGIQKLCSYEI